MTINLTLKYYLWEPPVVEGWLPLIFYTSEPNTNDDTLYYGHNRHDKTTYNEEFSNKITYNIIDVSAENFLISEDKYVWLNPDGEVFIASAENPIADTGKTLISSNHKHESKIYAIINDIRHYLVKDNATSVESLVEELSKICSNVKGQFGSYLISLSNYSNSLFRNGYDVEYKWRIYFLKKAFDYHCESENSNIWIRYLFALADYQPDSATASIYRDEAIIDTFARAANDKVLIQNSEPGSGLEKLVFSLGDFLKKSKDYELSIKAFEYMVDFNPENYASYLYLGENYQRIGLYAKALENYQKHSKYKKKSYYYCGEVCREDKKYTKAISYYKKFLKSAQSDDDRFENDNDPIKFHRATLHGLGTAQREYAKSLPLEEKKKRDRYLNLSCASYTKAINQDDADGVEQYKYFAVLHTGLAMTYLAQENYEDAENELTKVLDKHPDFIGALTLIINCYYKQKDFVKTIEAAINLHKHENYCFNIYVEYWLAESYWALNKPDEANNVYNEIQNQIDKNKREFSTSQIDYIRRRFENIQKELNKTNGDNKNSSEISNKPEVEFGKDLFNKKDYRKALEQFLLALPEMSDSYTCNSYIAQCYYYLKEYTNALEFAINSLKIENDNHYMLSLSGELYINLYKDNYKDIYLEGAEESFTRLRNLSIEKYWKFSYKLAQTGLAKVYTLRGNIPAAICNYKSVLDIDSQDIIAIFGLARSYEALEEFDLALEYYDKIKIINPSDRYVETAELSLKIKRLFNSNATDIHAKITALINTVTDEPITRHEWFLSHIKGMALLKLNKFPDAIKIFKYGITNCPEFFGKEFFETGLYLCEVRKYWMEYSRISNNIIPEYNITKEILALIWHNEVWPNEYHNEFIQVLTRLPDSFKEKNYTIIDSLISNLESKEVSFKSISIKLKKLINNFEYPIIPNETEATPSEFARDTEDTTENNINVDMQLNDMPDIELNLELNQSTFLFNKFVGSKELNII